MSTSETKPCWVVDVKGKPGHGFEISVVRSDNDLGFKSYGWYDERKLYVSSSVHESFEQVDPVVFERLVKLAEGVRDDLNAGRITPVQRRPS
jgi:hypothetical protein